MLTKRLNINQVRRGAETLCILDGLIFLDLFFRLQKEHTYSEPVAILTVLFVVAAALNLGFLAVFESVYRKAKAARDAKSVGRSRGISEKVVILDLWLRMGTLRLSVFVAAFAINILVAAFLVVHFLS